MSGTTHNFCHGLKGLQVCVLHLYLSKTGQVRYFNVRQCMCIFLSSHYVIKLYFHVVTIFHHAKIYISFLAFRNNHFKCRVLDPDLELAEPTTSL